MCNKKYFNYWFIVIGNEILATSSLFKCCVWLDNAHVSEKNRKLLCFWFCLCKIIIPHANYFHVLIHAYFYYCASYVRDICTKLKLQNNILIMGKCNIVHRNYMDMDNSCCYFKEKCMFVLGVENVMRWTKLGFVKKTVRD